METKYKSQLVLAGTPKHLELGKKLGIAKKDYLLINISGSCNYNCKKCCNLVPKKQVLLTLGKIKQLISEAKQSLGARAVVFIGEGETTLAPNFKEIIMHANSLGLYSVIFTNGYFVDKKLAGFLERNNTSVVFSIDSLNELEYEELTRTKNSFKRVLQNLMDCRKIFANRIRKEKRKRVVTLAINMLLTNSNKKEVKKMKEFCGNDILPVFNYPMLAGNANENKELFSKITSEVKKQASPTNLCNQENKCSYLFYGITIGLDGSVLACPYSLEMTGKTADISEIGLEKAVELQNKMASEFRKLDNKTYCIMRSKKYPALLKLIQKGIK